MKIVIIHGQSHHGTSYHIGRSLVDKLEAQENITEFFLPKDMPYFCSGCLLCLKEETRCPHYHAVGPITTSLLEADLLVFTTPVYCLRTTGSMKALLDHLFTLWITHRPKSALYFKQAVVIAVGAGSGMKKAAADIKTSLRFWGISDILVYQQRSMAASWQEVKSERKAVIEKDMAGLAERLKGSVGKGKVRLANKLMFLAMRMMQLKGLEACPEDKVYWQEQGWLGKKRPWQEP